jgi:ribonucleoside-diphosphate reductase alpha chain
MPDVYAGLDAALESGILVMKITRKFTKAGTDVYSSVEWTKRTSKISNLDGSTVFEMNDAEVPASWSQLATDIMVSKYFRKAGVPQMGEDGKPVRDEHGAAITGPEKSARQVIHRLAGCWTHWGKEHGYFDTAEDAQAFYDELAYMMVTQAAAPNSPQWFNTGLNFAYGISGPAQGHWVVDPRSGEVQLADDAYTHPQPHACFIQSIDDDLVNPGGIMDLWVREARLFKYGSGTGTNFSRLRGENEPLSGGGRSSGLMSFLKIGDRAAGAIKSGGTTRRAAKMCCLDLDHPDIVEFTNWKVREELKVAAMVEGMKQLSKEQRDTADRLGLQLTYDFNGEAYLTVSGQNSNNSIRITNEFFRRLDENAEWELISRIDGKVTRRLPARELWDQIGYAAWRCADPGVQYDTTINEWHTCPASGRINASNPCSEYMFLDNTACNLASFNLLKFYNAKTREFDVESFEHATRLWTIVLEISVLMAAFPSKEIARLSYEYRTLGLGYANIGAMLMQAGIPYDSEEARAICGAITSIMCGQTYATSAEMAGQLGPFPGYYRNKDHMLRVIRNHRRAAYGVPRMHDDAASQMEDTSGGMGDYEGLEIKPVPIDAHVFEQHERAVGWLANGDALLRHARSTWDSALRCGEKHGFRNAQTTVIAPTGTIGLLMDCDTTGVEPDFALVKFKKLAGGGYFKIVNQSVRPALEALGYTDQQVRDILTYVMGSLTLDVELPDEGVSFASWLEDKGLTAEELRKLTDALPTVFELSNAFNAWTLGAEAIERLGLTEQAKKPTFNLLRALGLSKSQIAVLNERICGTQTVEGAPHLKAEHLPVFDCANTCGPKGKRFIAAEGHIRMMAASQPFISGAISKTINLPNSASVDDIKAAYRLSWELGLKANALYRDGCKLSQPLSTKTDADVEADDDDNVASGKEEVASAVASLASRVAIAATDAPAPVEKIVERIVERPMRRRLPDTRRSMTHKFNVAGHEGYLTVGLYDDGTPGELFITMAKEGSTIGGLMDSLGTAISVALQYGVPVESLVNKFTHQRFEPAGMTHNPDIPFAKSLVDYIFRWMGIQFIPGYRAANTPQRGIRKDALIDAPRVEPLIDTPRRVVAGNGHSHSAESKASADDSSDEGGVAVQKKTERRVLDEAMREMQADAPACDVCGTITVRSGTCYKCVNCGNSMGCS